MKNTKAKILVVEDDQALLKGLLDVLIFNGYQATGVADGAEGLSRALAEQYDLLMLDVMLPSLDGFSICRGVRKSKPAQAIIIMTAKGAEEDIVAGFKAGADDYISKPFSLRELIVRIEAILRRAGKTLGDEHVHFGGIHFDGANLQATCEGRSVELTRREMDIISYLHRNRERIVSKKELLRDVWSYADTDIETRTVDIHILKLRKKIAALAQNGPIIQTVRGEGYRLEDGP
jgi:two-component system response regulator RegX3